MLIGNNQLNPTQLNALEELSTLCRSADGDVPAIYPHILVQKRSTESNVFYYEGDKLIGFLSVYFFYMDACEVAVLVDPSHRRQGIAKQLIQTIIPLVKAKQINTLIFSTAPAINEAWLLRLGLQYQNSEYHMQRKSYEPIFITNQALSIRKATEEDIPALCSIDELCFNVDQTNMYSRFMNLLDDGDYTLLLALHNEKAVGKAHIRWQAETATFSDIAIIPSCQKQGWGGELLSYCINHALTLGKTKLALDVETFNEKALNLYIRHGFKSVNTNDFWIINVDKLSTLLQLCT